VSEREKGDLANGSAADNSVGDINVDDERAGRSSGSGQATVSLALQVAQVAAQVSAARRSADEEANDELAARLTLAQARLQEQQGTPEGLILFLQVMRGVLRKEDVSTLVGDLPTAYRAVYEQLMDETKAGDQEGSLTVREVLDEVTHNVILAMVRGTFEQRRRMADTLLVMAEESRERPDLAGLRDLLQAARLLLQGADPTPIADRLRGPFRARWEEIVQAIQE
jgi:hypothetical protein